MVRGLVSNRPKERAKILDDFDHCVIKTHLFCCSKIYSLKDIWIFRYSNQKIITLINIQKLKF
jgi:hypothetical protein